MIECITGRKGKGKTKHLLEKVRLRMERRKGSAVYLDKSTKHMYELDKYVRLIDVTEYGIRSTEGFLGFICGILSQDRDLEVMFLDSFLTISFCNKEELPEVIKELEKISGQFSVDFVLSISADKEELPEEIYETICTAL
ncbi:MAG: twitching motility protein PilT [Lachnospiraceae bacterium]|nr:twitching motility protein PilT [Lachnospiraceae bacterium]